MNFAEAELYLSKGRNKQRRKLENNTYLYRDCGTLCVRLHDTDIITLYDDGRIQIKSGGWNTITTVDRINRYIPKPWHVFRERDTMFLAGGKGHNRWKKRCIVDATQGVLISADGKPKLVNSDVETVKAWVTRLHQEDLFRARANYWVRKARAGQNLKSRLTVKKIMAESNVTVRMAQVVVYGIERFLLDAGAKTIDSQAGYDLLNMYMGDGWGPPNIKALKMTCPSTGTAYVIPVDPNVTTVEEALDWSFNTENYLTRINQQA